MNILPILKLWFFLNNKSLKDQNIATLLDFQISWEYCKFRLQDRAKIGTIITQPAISVTDHTSQDQWWEL